MTLGGRGSLALAETVSDPTARAIKATKLSPRLIRLLDCAVSLSSFGGEGQGEEVVTLRQHARSAGTETCWEPGMDCGCKKHNGPLPHEPPGSGAGVSPATGAPCPWSLHRGRDTCPTASPVQCRDTMGERRLRPPLPCPLLQRRRGRTTRSWFASVRGVPGSARTGALRGCRQDARLLLILFTL